MKKRKNELGVPASEGGRSTPPAGFAEHPATPSRAPAQADSRGDTIRKGVTFGYLVEVRSATEAPVEACGKIYYPSWARVDFPLGSTGVPKQVASDPDRQILDFHGSMSYQAAQALRWWMHSEMGAVVMTRIRKHRIEYDVRGFNEGTIDEHRGSESEEAPVKDPEVWTHPLGGILKTYIADIDFSSEYWSRVSDRQGAEGGPEGTEAKRTPKERDGEAGTPTPSP